MIRAEDPRVEFSGIVAGMSGSPVYIDGKLMGAVAYAWSFAKEPLGGVTPIESMLAERAARAACAARCFADGGADDERARRRRRACAAARGATPTHAASARPTRWRAAWACRRSAPAPATASRGWCARRCRCRCRASRRAPSAELAEELRPTGLVPLQAGGGRSAGPPAAGHVEPGSAIGVELVRGDMSTVGTGTVTYVDGSDVLAFGHPMFGIGEVYLPLVDAEIHAFLPSLSQSFKMSSPLHEVGTLVQDRQSCIIGDLDARTTMMPVDVRVAGPGGEPRALPRRGGAQPAADADAGVDGGRQRHRRRRARRDRHDRDRHVQGRRQGLRAARAARPDLLAGGRLGPRARPRRAGCARSASCCSTRSSRWCWTGWTSTCASSSGATSPRSSACRCPARTCTPATPSPCG